MNLGAGTSTKVMPQESQGPGCQPWTPVASSAWWNLSCPGYSASAAPSSKSWAEASVERGHGLPPWLPAFRRAGVWPQRLPAEGRILPLIKTHTRADKLTLKIEFKYADTSSQNPKKIGKLKHPPLHPHVLCRYKVENQSPSSHSHCTQWTCLLSTVSYTSFQELFM